jgi:hypothetical protein
MVGYCRCGRNTFSNILTILGATRSIICWPSFSRLSLSTADSLGSPVKSSSSASAIFATLAKGLQDESVQHNSWPTIQASFMSCLPD